MSTASTPVSNWRRFTRNRPAVASAAVLGALVLLTLAWPWLAPYRPEALGDAQFAPPGGAHWFGTDFLGRDQLTRMFYGARVSLAVGAAGAAVSLVLGVLCGAVAGYVGGRVDGILMRFVDILYSLPSVVFAIVLIGTFEPMLKAWLVKNFSESVVPLARPLLLFTSLGAVSWLTMARIVRGQVLSLRHRLFVEASRTAGATHVGILRKHILPNIAGIVIAYLTLTIPTVILYESFLSYLGLGIQPPHASLGTLIAEGAGQINPIRVYWWMLVFPGGLLALLLLALNFLGDGLRDALEPRGGAK
ncbi:MAG: ABC transporter permease [Verrucomicrobia bacterium]|nr:ABC transporter permease [Verrucomicrobiota bacterium]